MDALPHPMVVRYVRGFAREKDPVGTAASMLEKTLAWRAEKAVDDALFMELPRDDVYLDMWPCMIHGSDRQGHPI